MNPADILRALLKWREDWENNHDGRLLICDSECPDCTIGPGTKVCPWHEAARFVAGFDEAMSHDITDGARGLHEWLEDHGIEQARKDGKI